MEQATDTQPSTRYTAGSGWHPVAITRTLPVGHIGQACLNGQDLALWQANDGHFNVWANRCLHRGVRLSLGSTDGTRLQCRYHGWQYANRTGSCTLVPAQPAQQPAASLCQRVFPSAVHGGLLWTSLQPGADSSELPDLSALGNHVLALRPLPFDAPASRVQEHLQQYRDADTAPASSRVFFVQPVNDTACVVFGLVSANGTSRQVDEAAALRRHNHQLTRMRRQVESTQHEEPLAGKRDVSTDANAVSPAKHRQDPAPGPTKKSSKNQAPRTRVTPGNRRPAPPDRRGAFTVHLARSQKTLRVEDGQSLLQALRDNGINVASACEQGACGTCRLRVLDGTPRHLDVFLTEAERDRHDCIMACVSRAASESLTLDL